MRAGIAILAVMVLAGGCATKHQGQSMTQQRHEVETQYAESGAATLAFDPPIAQANPRLNLARANREQSAFVGYDSTVVTSFYLRWDDRQSFYGSNGSDGNNDNYERRAFSVQAGVSYR
jgi:hypothetical protein